MKQFFPLTITASLALFCITAYNYRGYNSEAKPLTNDTTYAVLTGDYADPSIVRDGNNFYMTHSSYTFFPGLRIWHSTDLKHWKPIGFALHKKVGDVWAPDFVKYKSTFYIYFPADGTNWVITAKDPKGPWSDPVNLHVGGIDPGHIATSKGKRYLYFSGGNMVALSKDGLSVKGKPTHVYDGWDYPDNWNVECFCLESPKLTYHNGYYYLTSAEGGTSGPATSHMVVSARSKSPRGPWKNSPYNPVIHTYAPKEEWWSKGHGSLVDDGNGNWYIIYHAYKNRNYSMGRHTLIEPVKWTADGWFKTKRNKKTGTQTKIFDNSHVDSDDFSGNTLNLQWQFSGIDSKTDYELNKEEVVLQASPKKYRVMHAISAEPDYEATLKFSLDEQTQGGLILYYNQQYFAGIAKNGDGDIFGLSKGKKYFGSIPDNEDVEYFKIKLNSYILSMEYSKDGKVWKHFPHALEVSGYQTNMLGGFSSLKIGIFTRGQGAIHIQNFDYKTLKD